MTPVTDRIPEPLLWSLAATGLCLVLTLLAFGFVWLAMWPSESGDSYHPEVLPGPVQPGVPVVTP